MYHYVDNSMGAMEGQPPTTEYLQSQGQQVMPQAAPQHRWPSGTYGGYLNGGPMRWNYQYAHQALHATVLLVSAAQGEGRGRDRPRARSREPIRLLDEVGGPGEVRAIAGVRYKLGEPRRAGGLRQRFIDGLAIALDVLESIATCVPPRRRAIA